MVELQDFNFLFLIVIVTLTAIAQGLVFLRVGIKNFDVSMLVIQLAYLFSFILRLIFSGATLNLSDSIAANLIWSILFYFVFEMKKVENKLSSNSLAESNYRNKRLKKEMLILYSTYIGLAVLPIWVYYTT